VLLEVVTIPADPFAFWMKTLEDSRQVCVVLCHVRLEVVLASLDDLAAQRARVSNGGVFFFLVLAQLNGEFRPEGAARNFAGERP